ncbi:MAG: DUF2281 domain-containing protein [Methylococcales bacterium]
MNTAELIYQESKELPEFEAREVLDFVAFLKAKRQRKLTTDTQTDWAKLARRDDNEIDYSDAPTVPLESQTLRIRQPDGRIMPVKQSMIAIDEDIFMWFKNHDVNYQDRINQLLRDYIENDLVK